MNPEELYIRVKSLWTPIESKDGDQKESEHPCYIIPQCWHLRWSEVFGFNLETGVDQRKYVKDHQLVTNHFCISEEDHKRLGPIDVESIVLLTDPYLHIRPTLQANEFIYVNLLVGELLYSAYNPCPSLNPYLLPLARFYQQLFPRHSITLVMGRDTEPDLTNTSHLPILSLKWNIYQLISFFFRKTPWNGSPFEMYCVSKYLFEKNPKTFKSKLPGYIYSMTFERCSSFLNSSSLWFIEFIHPPSADPYLENHLEKYSEKYSRNPDDRSFEGKSVDAMDYTGRWLEAIVRKSETVSFTPELEKQYDLPSNRYKCLHIVTVHFIGYSCFMDEELCLESHRIAPHNTKNRSRPLVRSPTRYFESSSSFDYKDEYEFKRFDRPVSPCYPSSYAPSDYSRDYSMDHSRDPFMNLSPPAFDPPHYSRYYSDLPSPERFKRNFYRPSYNRRIDWNSSPSIASSSPSFTPIVPEKIPNPGTMGIRNLGNSCFMNSVFQCLFHCPPLKRYFLQKAEKADEIQSGDSRNSRESSDVLQYKADVNVNNPLGYRGQVVEHFASLLHQYWNPTISSLNPREFQQFLREQKPDFGSGRQQDCADFLTWMFDALHEDVNRVLVKPYVPGVESNGRPDAVLAQESLENYWKRNRSVVTDYVTGLLKSSVSCRSCHKEAVVFEPYPILSLPIPEPKPVKSSDSLESPLQSPVETSSEKLAGLVPYEAFSLPNRQIGHMLEFQCIYVSLDGSVPRVCRIRTLDIHPVTFLLDRFVRQFVNQDPLTVMDNFMFAIVKHLAIESLVLKTNSCMELMKRLNTSEDNRLFVYEMQKRDVCEKSHESQAFIPVSIVASTISPSFSEPPLPISIPSLVFLPIERVFISESEPSQSLITGRDIQAAIQKYVRQRQIHTESSSPKMVSIYVNDTSIGVPVALETLDSQFHRLNLSQYLKEKIEIFFSWDKKEIDPVQWHVKIENPFDANPFHSRTQPPVSLLQCLDAFRQPELLSGSDQWRCSSCKSFQDANKQIHIWSASSILVIHLKRFCSNATGNRKLNTKIDFPLTDLDMSPFLLESLQSQSEHESEHKSGQESQQSQTIVRSCLYDCIGIIEHHGFLDGGHYTCNAFHQDEKKWYCFNDSHVYPIALENLVTSDAYVLIYQKK